MKRRALLATAATVGIAGCQVLDGGRTGSGSESSSPSSTPTTERAAATATDSAPTAEETTSTTMPAADASVESSVLTDRETSLGREAALMGMVKNTGEALLGHVTIAGKFYNSDRELLDSTPDDVRALAPGEVWQPWLPYAGDIEDVEHGEIVVRDFGRLNQTPSPAGAELQTTSLEVPSSQNGRPRVTGTVENVSERTWSYLDARPKLYADNGYILGTGIDSIQSFSAGETWRFSAGVYLRNPSWKNRIKNHTVLLSE